MICVNKTDRVKERPVLFSRITRYVEADEVKPPKTSAVTSELASAVGNPQSRMRGPLRPERAIRLALSAVVIWTGAYYKE